MKSDNNALHAGAVLNEKYHILKVLGQGGFSIVYLAERISDGDLVVIKELFNNHYMTRLAPEKKIHLKNENVSSLIEEDKKRFHDEWNTLKMLETCEGSIDPIDFFEINETAYIVMEHLSGGSMKDIVKTKGYYDADTLFRKIKPVFQLLVELHKMGYVHRDISPDNLVMGADGNFKIIDFGAVRKKEVLVNNDDLLRKEGYTPLEAYKKNASPDPRSDIYSLCAVLYFALSGITPEDSLDRMIIDELLPLSEVRPECDPDIEQMVMKGLSLDQEDRWNSVDEIQKIISNFSKTEDERNAEKEANIRRQRRRKFAISAGIIAIVVMLVFVFCMLNKELLIFKGAQTQKIVLYFDENPENDRIDLLRKSIQQKLEHIAGNKYLLNQENDRFEITTTYELFQGTDIPNTINSFFNYEGCMIGTDSNGLFQSIAELGIEQIDTMAEQEDGVVLNLSNDLLETIKNSVEGEQLYALRIKTHDNGGNHMWDKANTPFEGDRYTLEANVDLNKGQVYLSDQSLGGETARKLFIDCLSQSNVPIDAFNYSRSIIWETKQDTTWGEYQIQESQFHGETVLLVYKGRYLTRNILDYDVYQNTVEQDRDVVPLKKRLDALKIPYACGWDSADESELYIRVGTEDIWEIEAAILFDSFLNDEELGVLSTDLRTPSGIIVAEVDTDTDIISDGRSVRAKVLNIKESEGTSDTTPFQLCIDQRPILQASAYEPADDGWITFDTVLLENETAAPGLDKLVDFLNVCFENPYISENYVFTGAIFLDSHDNPAWDQTVWDLNGCEMTVLRNAVYDYFSDREIDVDWYPYSSSRLSVYCSFDDKKEAHYEHPYAIVEEFLRTIQLNNEVSSLSFTISSKQDLTVLYSMDIGLNNQTGVKDIEWYIDLWNYNKEVDDPEGVKNISTMVHEEARQYLASKSVFTSCTLQPPIDETQY